MAVQHVNPVTVLLVDDQQLMRSGLRAVLGGHDDLTVVGEACDGAEAVRVAERVRPSVVLMELRTPGPAGVEATRRIVDAGLAAVLVLTTLDHGDHGDHALACLRAGAGGYLLDDTPPEQLVAAVRSVAGGGWVITPSVAHRLVQRLVDGSPAVVTGRRGTDGSGMGASGTDGSGMDTSALQVLTDREREVLTQVARGLSNAEVATRMFLSEATVKTHVGRVLAKLGLRDRAQAVVLAYETGLVRPGGPSTTPGSGVTQNARQLGNNPAHD
ncbi:response regulator transcription factor [Rhodococcus sp. X156]|uniref:LuxR C-terminal-related transcriptional regulator n=1 Tax=Rhodococcus sp. X156 TaxID=2499145 RepID=UPI0024083FC6|nr:response regulator transcription factor [Rhodococcus sp. X156]